MLSRGHALLRDWVGNHGVEPCNYRLIRAAPSPAGSLPLAEDGAVEAHRVAPAICFQGSGCHPGSFIFHERRGQYSKLTAGAARSLAARPSTLAGSLSLVALLGLEPRS